MYLIQEKEKKKKKKKKNCLAHPYQGNNNDVDLIRLQETKLPLKYCVKAALFIKKVDIKAF